MPYVTKTTEELRVGDVLKVWWHPKHDTITRIYPMRSPLAVCKDAKGVEFAILKTGMTCFANEEHEVLSKEE